ncbi:hypothetical protein [Burkholderia ubonensis]|uniref:hypothetical protein n=1 Tax=Burkholderia ubonensis TaxID=101571 RepID=UPI00075724CD|nr:hypothetical protein [Burkholderia ubonensis]KVQ06872.1 hypothetical protein WK00_09005 [Burkholderia ubonensis]KVT22984.1 hypothetical protein WK48_23045 [Burkholderia ubonensis]
MQVMTLRGPAVGCVIETYGRTVQELRKYIPDLLLVGGAVRDVYFKRPVKDLDFMTCDNQAARILGEYYEEAFAPCLRQKDDSYEAAASTLIAAYENPGRSINVLWVSGGLSHIAKFPDSISQIWTDGEQVYASEKFNRGAASRVVFYNERMTDERLARIQSKYEDFAFIPPMSERVQEG